MKQTVGQSMMTGVIQGVPLMCVRLSKLYQTNIFYVTISKFKEHVTGVFFYYDNKTIFFLLKPMQCDCRQIQTFSKM